MSCLIEIQNQIVGFFIQNDVMTSSDFQSIKVGNDLADKKDAAIIASLGLLAEAGLIKSLGDNTWILVAPLNSAGQEVHLSMATCDEIANVINMDLQSKDIDDRVNSLEIHEGHILTLLGIIDELLGKE